MSNIRLIAPKDTTQVSVEQQTFDVDNTGMVTVPHNLAHRLTELGFKHAPVRVPLIGTGITLTMDEQATLLRNSNGGRTPIVNDQQELAKTDPPAEDDNASDAENK